MNPLSALPPLDALNNPAAAVALGAGALGLIYLMFLRPRGRRPDPADRPPPRRDSLSAERQVERQMQSLMIELEQLSRRMGAQLDTKSAKLEQLIADADAKIGLLNAALAKAKAGEITDVLTARPPRPADESDSGLAGLDHHRQIYDLADRGEDVPAIARRTSRPAGEVELILALRGN